MRIFGDPARTKRLLQFAGMKAGEVIESGMLTRQIEKAQRKVESHNFDTRKQLLLFDDVANDQRKVIYHQRTEILGTADMSAAILEMFDEAVGGLLDEYVRAQQRAAGLEPRGAAGGLPAGLQPARSTRAPGSSRSRSSRRRRCARGCWMRCARPIGARSSAPVRN